MTTVVLDTNTVISAIFWPQSTARRCLAGLARRWYAVAVSADVFAEYEDVAAEFQSGCQSRMGNMRLTPEKIGFPGVLATYSKWMRIV